MKSVFDRFQLYWANQHAALEDALATERIRPLHAIQIPLLAGVIGFVHAFALRKIILQKQRLTKEPPPLPCDCGTPKYMGIPCWHILWKRLQGGGIVLLSDIHPHWYYDRRDGIEPTVGRQVIPLLNPDVVKGKGRPKGALGKKQQIHVVPGPGVDVMMDRTEAIAELMRPKTGPSSRGSRIPGRGRGRGRGRGMIPAGPSHQSGVGVEGTRRNPSAFEYDPFELPSSTAPARMAPTSPPPPTVILVEDDDFDELSPEGQALIDLSLGEIAEGRPAVTLSTTQLALARGAGGDNDAYNPGTVRERAYMRSRTTLKESEVDIAVDAAQDIDVTIRDLDLDHMPPPSSAPATLTATAIATSSDVVMEDPDFDWDGVNLV